MKTFTKTLFVSRQLVVALLLAFSTTAFSQIATWDLIGIHGTWSGGDPDVYTPILPVVSAVPATTSDADLTVSTLSVSPDVLGFNTNFDNVLGFSFDGGGDAFSNSFSFAQAYTQGRYVEFTLTPASGKTVTITSLDVAAFTQNALAGVVGLASSVDNFAAELDTIHTKAATNSINISPLKTLDVAGHENLTSAVTFRLYFYGLTQWSLQYNTVGIGNRHPGETTAALIVNGLVNTITGISKADIGTARIFSQNGSIVADLTSEKGAATVSVIDTKGAVVKTIQTAGSELLTINVANKGIYMVRVQNGAKTSTVKVVL